MVLDLTPTEQRVYELIRLDSMTQAQVANELGVLPFTIANHVYNMKLKGVNPYDI